MTEMGVFKMTKQNYEFILIRFGELALKGKNRKNFENRLQENIKRQMKDLPIKFERTFGRMYLYLNGADYEEVSHRLHNVFGISSFSPARKSSLDIEEMKRVALQSITSLHPFPKTFKVSVKRAYKAFPKNSQEMNQLFGAHILTNTTDLTVDVHHPDVELSIEIREDGAYFMSERYEGAGGLPIGTSGKVMLMLSGGIDSPVAGYLCMKRGLNFEAVHFHSYPFTSDRAKQKVVDLTKRLTKYVGQLKLHVVPFTDIQTEIRKHIPEDYSITIMRRIMLRIVEQLALKRKALGIATGENLGQVASQTLHSMHTINEVTNLPVLRPLLTMDKNEIIDIAKKIDTFDISILPYEDCCTIFQPKNPKTRPTRKTSHKFEQKLDIEGLIAEAVDNTELETYTFQQSETEDNVDNLF